MIPFKSLLKPGRTDNAKCPELRTVIRLTCEANELSWSYSTCRFLSNAAKLAMVVLITHTGSIMINSFGCDDMQKCVWGHAYPQNILHPSPRKHDVSSWFYLD